MLCSQKTGKLMKDPMIADTGIRKASGLPNGLPDGARGLLGFPITDSSRLW